MLTGYQVLMLTDDSQAYRHLGWLLAHKGCQVVRVKSDAISREALHFRLFDLILARIGQKGGEELPFVKQVRRRHPQVKIILCSSEGETAFPMEAYQLEADDYLLMPCRLANFWRRVVDCLKRTLGKAGFPAAGNGQTPQNPAILEKFHRLFHYFRYNLDASRTALQPLIKKPAPALDQRLLGKINEVSARLEVLQEMTEGFLEGISRVKGVTWAMPGRDS